MKEKRILTREEWKEIQEMQERAKAKRKAEEEKNKKFRKKLKLKRSIKNAIIILTSYAIITAILFIASNYIQSL